MQPALRPQQAPCSSELSGGASAAPSIECLCPSHQQAREAREKEEHALKLSQLSRQYAEVEEELKKKVRGGNKAGACTTCHAVRVPPFS